MQLIEGRLTTSQLHGFAEQEAKRVGIKKVDVSISHSDDQAIAVAVAWF
jgi:fatty acid synthase subunit alpha